MEHEQIDRRKALHWLDGDEKLFVRIKAIFKKNAPLQLAMLKESIYSGDVASAERMSHTLMGSSAMLGAVCMSEEAKKIERSCIDGDIESAKLHFTGFVAEYEKVMEELAADE